MVLECWGHYIRSGDAEGAETRSGTGLTRGLSALPPHSVLAPPHPWALSWGAGAREPDAQPPSGPLPGWGAAQGSLPGQEPQRSLRVTPVVCSAGGQGLGLPGLLRLGQPGSTAVWSRLLALGGGSRPGLQGYTPVVRTTGGEECGQQRGAVLTLGMEGVWETLGEERGEMRFETNPRYALPVGAAREDLPASLCHRHLPEPGALRALGSGGSGEREGGIARPLVPEQRGTDCPSGAGSGVHGLP